MADVQWFYSSGGTQGGPVTPAELKALAAAGQLTPTDLIWHVGLEDWMPASMVPDLFGLFASAPPVAADSGANAETVESVPDGASTPPAAVLAYQREGVAIDVSKRSIQLLRQTRPWVLLFSILGFIVTGLCVVMGLYLSGVAMTGATRGRASAGLELLGGLLVYLLIAAVYFFPALYLWRYASRISRLAARGLVVDLEAALEAQKSFWQIAGILVSIVILLYVVIAVLIFGAVLL